MLLKTQFSTKNNFRWTPSWFERTQLHDWSKEWSTSKSKTELLFVAMPFCNSIPQLSCKLCLFGQHTSSPNCANNWVTQLKRRSDSITPCRHVGPHYRNKIFTLFLIWSFNPKEVIDLLPHYCQVTQTWSQAAHWSSSGWNCILPLLTKDLSLEP